MSFNSRWRNRQLREHVAVIDDKLIPTLVLKNATYLNVYIKKWMQANIWIYEDRIVYVGDRLPEHTNIQMIDCQGQYLVPGYIEPHVHPFQLYNPHTLSQYASQTGTAVFINDNLTYLYLLDNKKAFSVIEELDDLPTSLYWWARFDSQSTLQDEEKFIRKANVLSWLKHDAVIQGGELTSWTSVLKDDDRMLHWMQEAKRLRKPVEGHFPGASLETLTRMKLLGADSDHEAISGEEAYKRLILGYRIALRHSSIRPDLRKILRELKDYDVHSYDNVMMTTDGSPPSFYESGIMNKCIEIAIEEGVPLEEAYLMASYNAAKHFGIDHLVGSIGPGRIAHINFLKEKNNPTPVSVLAKGKWIKYEENIQYEQPSFDWKKYGIKSLSLDWELRDSDFRFFVPIGLEMANDVIMKPFTITNGLQTDEISEDNHEAFLTLMDQHGEWRIATLLRGFTKTLGGLVSSYSSTGDITLIGKRKSDIRIAFDRMKEIGGGIVLADNGKVICELPLKLAGKLSDEPMEELIKKEKELSNKLKEHGYQFTDPIYTLLFLSASHLPYLRITPKGIIDVKKKEVLFPTIMR
ncbi:adenine deaminase C-terminal domain-containing protein [Salinibacillus xinjiangensis]|uniref:adenine deaminase n=1 Tax=Salinibacillus xinjiangensis TaxID=1229268 RepID=A0A6G1X8R9_9BACI|nr:adenine deaminase C-terminal domain-containing protein [Salinibacillus xinjiangensis]MRG87401.1 amidohydrolase family protein [Salinibacillus xinjiangensis]